MQYENMIYLGPEKETLDELAIRIKDIVNKAYPDIIRKGVVHSKKEQRKINARRKFWDLMPDNIQKQIFVKFGSCDAPLRQQLEYARRIETSDMRTNKAEQRYMQICAMEQPQIPTQSLDNISSTLNSISQQNKEIVQMVEKQASQQQLQQKPPQRRPSWQPQAQPNWQPPPQQNWQSQQQQNWQPQSQNWQPQPPQQWQSQGPPPQNTQNPKPSWTQQSQQQNTQQPQQQQQTQQPRPRPTCNYCHKIGHVKKYCRSNPESQNYGQYPPRPQQQIQAPQNQQQNQAPQQGYKPRPPPQDHRYGQNQNQQQQPKQGFLPSRSGHPQDLREKKAPMNAMPVPRVQQQQPFKPTAAACQESEEFAYLQHFDFDHEETLN